MAAGQNRWLRWLLRRLLGRDADALLSELDELDQVRSSLEGPAGGWARRWELARAVANAARYRLTDRDERQRPPTSPSLRGGSMTELRVDVRYGLRRLVRAPAFAAAVILTVALGIGGTTAVYSLVHGALIAPLPYPDPGRLVTIVTDFPGEQEYSTISMADYLAIAEQQTSFEFVGVADPSLFTVLTPEGAERVPGAQVTSSFFEVLGITAVLGRILGPEDDVPGAPRVVLLSHAFWQNRLGGAPDVVGSSLTLGEVPFTVIGVLPARVGPLSEGQELWTNLRPAPPPRKGPFFLRAYAKLRPDVDRDVAAEELDAIARRIFPVWQDSWPQPDQTWAMRDLKASVVGEAGRAIWVALGAVGILLLIACVNAASLLVARGLEQAGELGVRTALGASRRQLLGHLLGESVVLAVLSATVGVGLAAAGIRLAATVGGSYIPRTSEIGLTPAVLVFCSLVTVGAFLVFGLFPALQLSGANSTLSGRDRGRATSGASARRVRQALVGVQFAITTPLLLGGGLLIASLSALRGTDPGFDPERVLTVHVRLPDDYRQSESLRAFWDRVRAQTQALPGVEAVGLSDGRPPDEPAFGNNFVLEDRPLAPGEPQPSVPWNVADRGYFEAMGVALVAGRMFDVDSDPPRRALVDETWARRNFGNPEAAVGRRFLHGGCTTAGECEWWTVTGVVGDIEYNGLDQPDEGSMVLDAERYVRGGAYIGGFLVVRTARGDPGSLLPTIRRIVTDAEPRAPVTRAATGEQLISASLTQSRYLTALVGAFSGVALLLTLVGVYAVMSHLVRHRRREIGIRLTLGADPRSIVGMVVAGGARLIVAGIAGGVGIALLLTGFLEGLLFGVEPLEATTWAAVLTGLLSLALVSCLAPAVRASRLDPGTTLRDE